LLKKIEAFLVRLESGLLVVLLSLMVIMAFAQVAMRQFFGTGILWGDTFLRHLVLWVGFLGAALATVDEKHFAWDTAVSFLTGHMKTAVMRLAHAATCLITLFLIKASWNFCLEEKAAGSVLFNVGGHAVPSWAFSTIIPVGFLLVLIHTLIKMTKTEG